MDESDTAKTHSYPLMIRESHLDTFGHVNNAVYLQLFEEARWDLVTANGYGLDTIRSTGLGPTILEAKLKFLKELRLRDLITIKTRLISYKGKIGVLEQWMEKAGIRCCEMEMTFGLFDVRLRKLVPPTPEWLRAIGGES